MSDPQPDQLADALASWHHNVTTRCGNWPNHEGDDRVPHPCPDCYSVETLSRWTDWQPPHTHDRSVRPAAAAGYEIVPLGTMAAYDTARTQVATLTEAIEAHRKDFRESHYTGSTSWECDEVLWAGARRCCGGVVVDRHPHHRRRRTMSDVSIRMRSSTIDASPAAMGRFLRRLGDDIERADGDLVLIAINVYPNESDPLGDGEWTVQTIVDAARSEGGS